MLNFITLRPTALQHGQANGMLRLMHHCTIASQHHRIIEPLHNCITAPPHYRTTALVDTHSVTGHLLADMYLVPVFLLSLSAVLRRGDLGVAPRLSPSYGGHGTREESSRQGEDVD